ncbi:hypothetical protein MNBD_UNCLBAC01-1197 [hydrothermal vent metagenome]|uniref:Transglutaminase-like domain-containing protein n=1 Tax=hydrothermal vent metagenome TaxID=652676 RepID=A0A3B1DGN9_9ZZZZ
MRNIFLMGIIFLSMTVFVLAEVPKSRSIEFNYEIVFKNVPENAKELKVWIPALSDTEYQKIKSMVIDPENLADITYDTTYQNKIINFIFKNPSETVSPIKVNYKVERLEYAKKVKGDTQKELLESKESLAKFLKINRLGELTEETKQIAREITKGKKATLDKARAIYDYVFENVSYDKEIPGWGKGDTARVCNLKAGNCTDFHSLFISMARENNIPAKFVIGVPFKANVTEGEYSGYHCWAEFYDETQGWVPVDISEASKDKSKYEYHFGAIDENRIEFSQGRDIVLEPKQQGEPLNYFIYPYAEVDGKVFKGVGILFKFRDVGSTKNVRNKLGYLMNNEKGK